MNAVLGGAFELFPVVLWSYLLGLLVVVTPMLGDQRAVGALVGVVLLLGAATGTWAVGVAEAFGIAGGALVCRAAAVDVTDSSSWYRSAAELLFVALTVAATYVAVRAWFAALFGSSIFAIGVVTGLTYTLPSVPVAAAVVSLVRRRRSVEASAPPHSRPRAVAALVATWLFAGYAASFVFDAFEYVTIARVANRLSPGVATLVDVAGPSGRNVTLVIGCLALLALFKLLYLGGVSLPVSR
jgi:hypothetical protein